MKINRKIIHKELRFTGFIYRFVDIKSEKSIRKSSEMSRKMMIGKTSKRIHCEARVIKTRLGNDLRICIYSAKEKRDNAVCLLWFHGGGYALGAPEMDLSYYEMLIEKTNCVIVAPDYRLSVEAPFPAALDDCYEALYWVKAHSNELKINDDQIFVGGNSAGGGLAAAVTLYARDRKEINIAFAMMLYPMLDDRMNTVSMKDNNAPVWNEKSNAIAWRLYLGELYGSENISKYAAPARETDYRGLPPAYTFAGTIEPFFDEVVEYFQNLQNAGIDAKIDVYENCFHAFDSRAPKKQVSRRATEKMLAEFKFATDNYRSKQ